ncbi:MAG TPA: hypothetical protein VGP72_06485 [Planctomycetota bacterium]|jgi:hypothetical protein
MLQRFLNQLLRDRKLTPADKLYAAHAFTWGARHRNKTGKLIKSSTEFYGWNRSYACKNLGIEPEHVNYAQRLKQFDFITVDYVLQRGRNHTRLRLKKPLSEYTYFVYPEAVLTIDILNPTERTVLLLAFMLRDQSNYQLRSDRSFINEISCCLGLGERQAKYIKKAMVDAGFLKEIVRAGKPSLFELLPHQLLDLDWDALPLRKHGAPEVSKTVIVEVNEDDEMLALRERLAPLRSHSAPTVA